MAGGARKKCDKCGRFMKQENTVTWTCNCGHHIYVPEPNNGRWKVAKNKHK